MYYYTLILIFLSGSYSAANTHNDSIVSEFIKIEDRSTKVELAIRLSREFNHNGSTKQRAFHYANLAIELAEPLNNNLLLAQALDNFGLLHRFNQQYAQAIPLHRRAFNLIIDTPGNKSYKMRFANNVGVAARYDQNHALAVEYYLKALGIAQSENNLRNIAISSNGLGNSLSYLDPESQEAMSHFHRALDTERKRGNQRGVAMNLLSIANYYTRQKNFTQARNILDELLTINQQINDLHGIAITYEYFGHNYLKEGQQYNQAERYYSRSLSLFEDLENRLKMADLLRHLGQVAEIRGSISAYNHYSKALNIAKEGNHKALIVAAAERLSELNENAGNYQKALHYNKKAEAYNDSLDLIRQQSVIQGLHMQYNFEQKENEIQLLRANEETREAEMFAQQERFKRVRIYFIASIIIVLSITSLIILFLRNINLKKTIRLSEEEQIRQRLEQEYQRNLWQAEILASRMQMNPHFLFNCLNSVKFLIQQQHDRKAIKYLTTLSKFMREILQTGKSQKIPLKQELDLVQKYIQLEAMRFDQQLDFQLETNNANETMLETISVPPMLLQPFVENAIWHGLVPSNSNHKKLTIKMTRDENKLAISIIDNGVGRQHKKLLTGTKHQSMGTKITEDRIDLFNKITNSRLRVETLDLTNDQQKPAGTQVNLFI